jgi:hypothetical protein
VQLVLSFPGLLQPIAIDGEVRWTRDETDTPGAGIQFFGPGRDRLVARRADRSGEPGLVSKLFRVLVVEDNRHVAELIRTGCAARERDFGGVVSFAFRRRRWSLAVELLGGRSSTRSSSTSTRDPRRLQGDLARARPARPRRSADHRGLRRRRCRASLALEAGANIFIDKPMRLRQVIDRSSGCCTRDAYFSFFCSSSASRSRLRS